MTWIIIKWLLMLFALASGLAKVFGAQIERQGAEQFGIDYNYIILMGVLQLASIPLVYLKYYLGGVILLGLPYFYFVYIGVVYKQYTLSIFSLIVAGLTILLWYNSFSK